MGATLGQGWLFGRPAPRPAEPAAVPGASILPMRDVSRLASQSQPERGWAGTTPYELVAAQRSTRVGPKRVLLDLSRHVEEHALAIPEHPVVVGAFQLAERFTPGTRRRYERLAAHCSLTAALGVGLDARSVEGVLGGPLRADDALSDEWSVVVVGPQSAIALVARDLHSGGADGDRLFDFAVTCDRELVVSAARSLLARIQSG
jgi:DICT domain-containing protein